MLPSSEKNKKLKSHRDVSRKKTASKAVQGMIFSKINKSCFGAIEKELDTSPGFVPSDKLLSFIDAAKKSNETMTQLCGENQTSINTDNCMRYTSHVQNTIKLCIKNDKSIKDNQTLCQDIVTKDMIELNKLIFSKKVNSYNMCKSR